MDRQKAGFLDWNLFSSVAIIAESTGSRGFGDVAGKTLNVIVSSGEVSGLYLGAGL